jgi:cytoskeleton protein RodZ
MSKKVDTMSRSEKNAGKPQGRQEEDITSQYGHTGNYLRTLREEKGLSIADVSQATRISETNLRAIEEQNFAALPADTFTRGLLNIYAKFLEIDPADLVSRFMQERDDSKFQEKRFRGKPSRSLLTPKTMAEPAHVSPMFMAGVILLVIVVLFTGFCIYTSWNPFSFLFKEKYNIHAVIENTFPDSNSSSPAGSRDADIAPSAPDGTGIAIPSGKAGEKAAEPAAPDGEPVEPGHTLTVRFLTDGVVTVTRDNAEPFNRAYIKGQEDSWSAGTSMTVTFDKPNSAEVFVNNTPVDFPPDENGSFTLRIPEDLPQPSADD